MAPHAENDPPATEEKTVNGDKSENKPKTKGKKSKAKTEGQNKERIQRLDQLYSKKTRENYFVPTPKNKIEREQSAQNSHVVLKVRRLICDKGFPTGTEIDIKSTLLRDGLSEIFEGVEGLKLNESPPEASPELLFYAKGGLESRVKAEKEKSSPNQTLIDHFNVALKYVEEDHGPALQNLASLAEHGEITFSLLWTLFAPKTVVYTKDNKLREDQILQLKTGEYGAHSNGSKYFSLDLRSISHDGQKLGWAEMKILIDQFEGTKKINNLNCFPLSHHPEEASLRDRLLQRGKRYIELLKDSTYQEYTGVAMYENRDVFVDNEFKKVTIHVSGRIMLDPTTFHQHNEYSGLQRPDVETELSASTLSGADLLYCNHSVAGFSFRQKKWCLFAISRMSPVVWNPNAFSKLVMEPRKRDLIHSLVKSHRNGSDTFDDIVAGKGRGLVGLLSGNPGVGKTLTAEVIAEVTKRPLYMLSAGELGTYVDHVEKKLDMVLEVTRQWGCVLLIDEADVFLQERDGVDLERNALVSIFLRRLEYFQGVLIMTTNRKRTIDLAFDSRIHFKLHYEDLSVESRATIWRNCLENSPARLKKMALTEGDVMQLAKLDLNGRQIKNAVACAVSIAMEEKTELTVEAIKIILEMVIENKDEE